MVAAGDGKLKRAAGDWFTCVFEQLLKGGLCAAPLYLDAMRQKPNILVRFTSCERDNTDALVAKQMLLLAFTQVMEKVRKILDFRNISSK